MDGVLQHDAARGGHGRSVRGSSEDSEFSEDTMLVALSPLRASESSEAGPHVA